MLNSIQFTKEIEKLLPDYQEKTFLCAASGGADSMVLLHLMLSVGLKIQVAHVNYKLRGEASDKDQKVVEEFCAKHTVQCHIYTVTEKDAQPENSIQLWARDLRYRFFYDLLNKENIDFIVTAHHLNDELETFLINLSRGAGIKGLSGIPNNQNKIIRPLLGFSKQEIYDFSKTNQIAYREDASNQKNDYLRNRFRNLLIPELVSVCPDFLQQFSKSIHYLAQANAFVEEESEAVFLDLSIDKGSYWILNKTQLLQQRDLVQFQILKKFGITHPLEINKMLRAQSGSRFVLGEYYFWINRNELLISTDEAVFRENSDEIILIESFEKAQQMNFQVDLTEYMQDLDCAPSMNKNKWVFDSGKMIFPIKLRRKKKDDVFYPLGMKGKKKVSKFFKDEKISILAKPKIWLLVDGNDCVLGVLPFRQDGRCTQGELKNAEFCFFWSII